MVSLLEKPQARPSPTAINQLIRIGELKQCLNALEQETCGALGLQAQLNSLPRNPDSPGAVSGFWKRRQPTQEGFRRLRALVGHDVPLDAWQEVGTSKDWSVVRYAPGDWEALCQPTLRLVQWLHERGGLNPEMHLTLQMAVERYRDTGALALPLRQETGGRLCGRCGEEVQNLRGHIQSLHDRPNAQFPLAAYIRLRDGQKSVLVAQSKGTRQHMWTVPEELHRPEAGDPRFRPGLALDIEKACSMAGKAHSFPKNGSFPLPDDITPLPYLASVLRRLTRGDVLLLG